MLGIKRNGNLAFSLPQINKLLNIDGQSIYNGQQGATPLVDKRGSIAWKVVRKLCYFMNSGRQQTFS